MKDELAAQGSWGRMLMGYFESTLDGLGAVLSSIPVILKLKPEPTDTNATKLYSKMEVLKSLLEDIKEKNEKLQQMQQEKADKIRETMSKMTEIDASTSTEEDVLRIIELCIQSIVAMKDNWVVLVKFFEKIQEWIEKCTGQVNIKTDDAA